MTAELQTPRLTPQAEPFGVSLQRAAELLNVHTNTVRNRLRDGTLKSYRVGSRVLVKLDSIKELVK